MKPDEALSLQADTHKPSSLPVTTYGFANKLYVWKTLKPLDWVL